MGLWWWPDERRARGDGPVVIRVEVSDGVTRIVWSRPEAANALPLAGWTALLARLEQVAPDLPLVLEGEGRWFSGGFDQTAWRQFGDEAKRHALETLNAVLERVRRHPSLTVALMNGAAAGGGLVLALETDWRVARVPVMVLAPMADMGVVPSPRFLAQLEAALGAGALTRLLLDGARMRVDPDDAHQHLIHAATTRLPQGQALVAALRARWPADGTIRLQRDIAAPAPAGQN